MKNKKREKLREDLLVISFAVFLCILIIVLQYTERSDGYFIYPSGSMIKGSKADLEVKIIMPNEIQEQIYNLYTKAYPKETRICLNGYVINYNIYEQDIPNQDVYVIQSVEQGYVKEATENYVNGHCFDNTLLEMHTHTNQEYKGQCKPSESDLSYVAKRGRYIEGLVCGNSSKPEKIVFYDTYKNIVNFNYTTGNTNIYKGYIDSNKFQVEYMPYIKRDGFIWHYRKS